MFTDRWVEWFHFEPRLELVVLSLFDRTRRVNVARVAWISALFGKRHFSASNHSFDHLVQFVGAKGLMSRNASLDSIRLVTIGGGNIQ